MTKTYQYILKNVAEDFVLYFDNIISLGNVKAKRCLFNWFYKIGCLMFTVCGDRINIGSKSKNIKIITSVVHNLLSKIFDSIAMTFPVIIKCDGSCDDTYDGKDVIISNHTH